MFAHELYKHKLHNITNDKIQHSQTIIVVVIVVVMSLLLYSYYASAQSHDVHGVIVK